MRETQQLRGQAFVVFRSLKQAEIALEALNAFNLFGKDLVSQLANLIVHLGLAFC